MTKKHQTSKAVSFRHIALLPKKTLEKWHNFQSQVPDNFFIISRKKFRVLECYDYTFIILNITLEFSSRKYALYFLH